VGAVGSVKSRAISTSSPAGSPSATMPGRPADAPACTGKIGPEAGMTSQNWGALANRGRFWRFKIRLDADRSAFGKAPPREPGM
jgi:hypothetical protein